MGRLNGPPLSVTPMSLQWDDHATGLSRRWSGGWWVLTWLACVVRQRLAATGTGLAGVSTGHPKRATPRSTTERLLKCVEGLTLTSIRAGRRRYHLTPLSRVQRRILSLLNSPLDTSTRLCPDAHQPPQNERTMSICIAPQVFHASHQHSTIRSYCCPKQVSLASRLRQLVSSGAVSQPSTTLLVPSTGGCRPFGTLSAAT
jgi:hypothetical protein